jgi:hypothetical protein
MTIKERAEQYNAMFTTGTRNDGKSFVKCTDEASEALRESIRNAHGDKLPNDWTYGTYADLMQRVTEYDVVTINNLEDVRSEIVDSYVDIYTADLTKWLAEDIRNVYYITQALEEYGTFEDGFKLLAMAQYLAIDEVMQEVINLLGQEE